MAMTTNKGVQQSARASLTSLMLTAVAITVHHTYTLGAAACLLGVVLLVVPAVLLTWFRRTGSRPAFIGTC
jgi:hypothetical protein